MKTRAVYVPTVKVWDVWVGPDPEPVTGRKLTAARWGLQVEGTGAARLYRWLLRMENDPARCERARDELEGQRLGCNCPPPCHAVALARIAGGESPREIRAELESMQTRPLFTEGAR